VQTSRKLSSRERLLALRNHPEKVSMTNVDDNSIPITLAEALSEYGMGKYFEFSEIEKDRREELLYRVLDTACAPLQGWFVRVPLETPNLASKLKSELRDLKESMWNWKTLLGKLGSGQLVTWQIFFEGEELAITVLRPDGHRYYLNEYGDVLRRELYQIRVRGRTNELEVRWTAIVEWGEDEVIRVLNPVHSIDSGSQE